MAQLCFSSHIHSAKALTDKFPVSGHTRTHNQDFK
uniref:Uncharacterized protein n=1 Tax=Anguilla anguilla TaxID=7936 RepID=A0A0E9RW88_ANGAN